MRNEGISKMGFYPTPLTMVEKIAQHLEFEGAARLFDPCAGEGEALKTVTTNAPDGSISYGIELDGNRAEQAKKRLHHILSCAYEVARVEDRSMDLLYLNPPYDNTAGQGMGDGGENRKELTFLRDLSKKVTPNGVLVFIVPRYTLTVKMVDALSTRYTALEAYRFDDKEYKAYSQVVVFGTRRAESTSRLTKEEHDARNRLLFYGKNLDEPMPYLEDDMVVKWIVPQANMNGEPLFRGRVHDPEELRRDLAASDCFSIVENMLQSEASMQNLARPLLPFRRTHLATLIAAGALNGAVGVGEARHMVVGMSKKIKEISETTNEKGDKTSIVATDRYITAVRVVEANGTIIELQ
jgi:hypothetical protein